MFQGYAGDGLVMVSENPDDFTCDGSLEEVPNYADLILVPVGGLTPEVDNIADQVSLPGGVVFQPL